MLGTGEVHGGVRTGRLGQHNGRAEASGFHTAGKDKLIMVLRWGIDT